MALLRLWFLTIVFLIPLLSLADDGFVIDRYDVEMVATPNAVVAVTETIDVTFTASKHGIYREIPNRYEINGGPQRRVSISGIDVPGEGTLVSQNGNNLRIRIGDADTILPPGTHRTYVIRYQVRGALNWFEGDETWEPRTEIYWNVIGPNWPTTIAKTDFRLTYPDGKKSSIKPRLYVGYYGSTKFVEPGQGGPGIRFEQASGQVSGSISQTLNPGQSVSVVVAVPAGLIRKPAWYEELGDFIRVNWGLLLPLPLAAVLTAIWFFVGRDPKLGPPGVRFDPPPGIDPAFAGVLIDDKVDGRDITAGVMSLAVKGYLKFVSNDPHGRFDPESSSIRRTNKPVGSDLSAFESNLLDRIFAGGTTYLTVNDMVENLRFDGYTLTKKLRDRLVKGGYYRTHPDEVRGQMAALPIMLVFLVIWAGGFFSGVLSHIGLIPSMVSLVFGLIACVPVYGFFMVIMPSRTPLGAVKHNECLAFFEAMKRRAHYNDWFTKTNLDQAKYEEYLPYAVAFGLTREWSAICNSVIRDLPTFCETGYAGPFDYYLWSSSFNHNYDSMNSELSSITRPPSNSGGGSSGWSGGSGFSGGGEFSGGGFGGGGGGSW